jgi:hypothetical protein
MIINSAGLLESTLESIYTLKPYVKDKMRL